VNRNFCITAPDSGVLGSQLSVAIFTLHIYQWLCPRLRLISPRNVWNSPIWHTLVHIPCQVKYCNNTISTRSETFHANQTCNNSCIWSAYVNYMVCSRGYNWPLWLHDTLEVQIGRTCIHRGWNYSLRDVISNTWADELDWILEILIWSDTGWSVSLIIDARKRYVDTIPVCR
jgi:hypothetical protein